MSHPSIHPGIMHNTIGLPSPQSKDRSRAHIINNALWPLFQAATQFKGSLAHLMAILMSKEPSYVRCIKPNDYKRAKQFDIKLVHHQVQYLGLMENLRVRRAGFAYRREYEVFLRRSVSICTSSVCPLSLHPLLNG